MRKSIGLGVAVVLGFMGAAACSSSSNGNTGTAGETTTTSSSTATTSGTTTTTGAGGGTTDGPGADLKCDSSGKNAFQTYGASAFVTVNKAIFANTQAEVTAHGSANIGDSFTLIGSGTPPSTADNAATFEGKLAAFLVWVYGGPNSITYTDNNTYVGNNQNMVTAHTGLAITNAQYTYFVTNIVVPALTSSGVKHGAGGASDPDDVSSCFAPPILDTTFVASIVGH